LTTESEKITRSIRWLNLFKLIQFAESIPINFSHHYWVDTHKAMSRGQPWTVLNRQTDTCLTASFPGQPG